MSSAAKSTTCCAASNCMPERPVTRQDRNTRQPSGPVVRFAMGRAAGPRFPACPPPLRSHVCCGNHPILAVRSGRPPAALPHVFPSRPATRGQLVGSRGQLVEGLVDKGASAEFRLSSQVVIDSLSTASARAIHSVAVALSTWQSTCSLGRCHACPPNPPAGDEYDELFLSILEEKRP